jgi:hypothetical protein
MRLTSTQAVTGPPWHVVGGGQHAISSNLGRRGLMYASSYYHCMTNGAVKACHDVSIAFVADCQCAAGRMQRLLAELPHDSDRFIS